jgi:hypothetical protein
MPKVKVISMCLDYVNWIKMPGRMVVTAGQEALEQN